MKYVLLFFIGASAAIAQTQSAVIKEVDRGSQVVAIETKAPSAVGERWVWSQGDEQCTFEVYGMKGNIANARSTDCQVMVKVKVGQKLRVSLIDAQSQTPPSMVKPTDTAPKREEMPEKVTEAGGPSEDEAWYLYFGGGFSATFYGGDYGRTLDSVNDMSSSSRGSITGDLFGIYMPLLGRRTAVGLTINMTSESVRAEDAAGENVSMTITQGTVGPSIMHFFGENIGHRWFVRSDVGYSHVGWDVKYDEEVVGTQQNASSNEGGFGALVGAGYGLRLSPGARMLLGVNYSGRWISGDYLSVIALNVGVLF